MLRLSALLTVGVLLCSFARAGTLEEAVVWWRMDGPEDHNGPTCSALEQVGDVRFETGEVPGRFSDGRYARFGDGSGASYLTAGPHGAGGEIAEALCGPSTIWVRVRVTGESRHGILSKDGSRDKPRGALLFDDAALGNGLQGAIGFEKHVHGPTVDSLALNVWHDVTLVFDPEGPGIVLAVRRTEDAALISRAGFPWSRGSRQASGDDIPLMLGSYNRMPGTGLVGDVAEVAIWNRALSQEEIAMLTSSQAPPDLSGQGPARSYRELFLDDERIESTENVRRVLHEGSRHETNPLIVPDKPWEGGQCFTYGGAVYVPEEKLFKIWYRCGQKPELYDYCVATSSDGVHWDKPMLATGETIQKRYDALVRAMPDYYGEVGHPKAPAESNIVLGHQEMEGFVYTPQDRAERRYKTIGGGGTKFVSADGVHWKNVGRAFQAVEVNPFSYNPDSGRYVAFPKINHNRRRSVGFTSSPDFDLWDTPRLILVPDAEDDRIAAETITKYHDRIMVEHDDPATREAHFYGLASFEYQGLIVGFLWVLHVNAHVPGLGDDGPMDVQLVASRDGKTWTRVAGRKPILPLGPKGAFDGGMITTCSAPLIVGDEIWLYYGGIAYTHANQDWYLPEPVAERMKRFRAGECDPPAAIGLAKWRLDGFCSMRAQSKGSILTKPLQITGSPLVLNAEAVDGNLAAEILTEAGNPLEGFALADCDPFTGDSLSHTVTWHGRSDLSELVGKTLRLRFVLINADLFSYGFQAE